MSVLTTEAAPRRVLRDWKFSVAIETAIGQFAAAYADQNERDHQALVDAVTSGKITAERGL